nr:hypothetical protein [Tanacetum cinerariifolium]
ARSRLSSNRSKSIRRSSSLVATLTSALVLCDRAWHTSHVLGFPCKNIEVPLQECAHRRPASVRQRPPIDTSCSGCPSINVHAVDIVTPCIYLDGQWFHHCIVRSQGDPTCLLLLIYQLAGAVESTHWWCGPSVYDIRSTHSPRAALLECALVVVSGSLRLQLQVSPLESFGGFS